MQSTRAGSTTFDLVAGIYEAGVNPDLWDEVMPGISGIFGGAGVAFGIIEHPAGLAALPGAQL